jgi:hypothetical protein
LFHIGEVFTVFKKVLAGLALLVFPIFLHAQAVSPVTPERASINVGGYFSIAATDYGQNLGFTNRLHRLSYAPGAYGDFNYFIWRDIGVGVEGEARFINFHTPFSNGTYEENFLGGPRITYRVGRRLLPYAKFLAGGTRFHYPNFISNQAFNYTTLAGGGGLDVRLTRRFTLRPVDFEYQHLSFPPTGLTPWVYSAGLSFRVF